MYQLNDINHKCYIIEYLSNSRTVIKLEVSLNNNVNNNDNVNNTLSISLDNIDFRIISLLLIGSSNKIISDKLKVPLSTVQRRARNILNLQRGDQQ